MPPLDLRPEAKQDLAEARDWYDGERPGLGDEFLDAVDGIMGRIEASPRIFAVTYRKVRQVKVPRFPYVIHYRAFDDCTEVLAVMHGSRNPAEWKRRLK